MNSACRLVVVVMWLFAANTALAAQIGTFRNTIIYPYHAAPYYSYPYTTGYGYVYSTPAVNAEYHHTFNNRQIVIYPDGPYEYDNYYRVGTTYCFQHAHVITCLDY